MAFTFDGSPPSGAPGVLVAFIEGDAARELGRELPETRRKVIVDALAALFGPRAAEPRDYVELDWTEEEWTRGCYGGHMPPGVLTRYGPALREPVGRIHWAGTENARVWCGYDGGSGGVGRARGRRTGSLTRASKVHGLHGFVTSTSARVARAHMHIYAWGEQ